jgi:hypothetical protein
MDLVEISSFESDLDLDVCTLGIPLTAVVIYKHKLFDMALATFQSKKPASFPAGFLLLFLY